MRSLGDPAFFRFHGLAAASGFPESFAGGAVSSMLRICHRGEPSAAVADD